jgi:hypothetical protein
MPHFVVRRIRIAHCKKGPARCDKCREMDAERICLLEICPQGDMQRRVIQIGDIWQEFEVARVFESEEDARAYADEHGIQDVVF